METKMEAVSVDFVKQHKPYQKAWEHPWQF